MAERTQKKKNSNPVSKKKKEINKSTNKTTRKKSNKPEIKLDKNFIKEVLKKPEMMKHLIPGLSSRDTKKVSNSAKLFNEITKLDPNVVLKYGKKIVHLLKSKHTHLHVLKSHTLFH